MNVAAPTCWSSYPKPPLDCCAQYVWMLNRQKGADVRRLLARCPRNDRQFFLSVLGRRAVTSLVPGLRRYLSLAAFQQHGLQAIHRTCKSCKNVPWLRLSSWIGGELYWISCFCCDLFLFRLAVRLREDRLFIAHVFFLICVLRGGQNARAKNLACLLFWHGKA